MRSERRVTVPRVLLVLGVVGAWWLWPSTVRHPPGILVAEEPVQLPVEAPVPSWERLGYRFSSLARFDVRARLLSVERYRFDGGAKLAPLDFALGWGRMSDSAVIDRLTINQGGRFYTYFWLGEAPIPQEEIVSHSANMHLIPSDDAVFARLKRVPQGSVIRLRGHLVQIDGPGGWKWTSSTTRLDSGDGACEVVWVESVEL